MLYVSSKGSNYQCLDQVVFVLWHINLKPFEHDATQFRLLALQDVVLWAIQL